MEVELRERRSRSANKTLRLRGPKIPRSGGTEVQTIEARVTYQNIGKMAQGSELGVVTRMVPECSRSVWRWSGVSGVRVEIHGYDSTLPLHLSLTLPWVPLLSIQSANPFCSSIQSLGTSVPDLT